MVGRDNQEFNKHILIAVDESPNARRAVIYVAKLLGGLKGCRMCLLHILSLPEADFFPSPEAKETYRQNQRKKVDRMLEEYRQILISYGFPAVDVSIYSPERYCPSIAECILSERDTLRTGTIVVGRKGVSRKEEVLFGSVSSMIVKKAKGARYGWSSKHDFIKTERLEKRASKKGVRYESISSSCRQFGPFNAYLAILADYVTGPAGFYLSFILRPNKHFGLYQGGISKRPTSDENTKCAGEKKPKSGQRNPEST
jgi:nucleotide-binding universal stress UspA family protein